MVYCGEEVYMQGTLQRLPAALLREADEIMPALQKRADGFRFRNRAEVLAEAARRGLDALKAEGA